MALGFAPALAASAANGFGLTSRDTNAPIAVSANSSTADLNAKTLSYTGNVVVTQGNMKLHADFMRLHTEDQKPDTITANGNVVFAAPSGSAQGDAGVYNVAARTITLTGRVILSREKNVMRGSVLVVNLVTGIAQLTAKGLPGGRVQGLFTPPPQSSGNSQTPKP
jgi:lipopolysaccharide export system protein LptA